MGADTSGCLIIVGCRDVNSPIGFIVTGGVTCTTGLFGTSIEEHALKMPSEPINNTYGVNLNMFYSFKIN